MNNISPSTPCPDAIRSAIIYLSYIEVGVVPDNPALGLCAYAGLDELKVYYNVDISSIFVSWPEFSGRLAYPVPAPGGWDTDKYFAAGEYFSFMSDEVRNLYIGEYGVARMRLAGHIINELKKLL